MGKGKSTAWLLTAFAFCGVLPGQNVSEHYLLAAANADRAAHALSPLRIDVHLSAAAHRHAGEMARHQEISHQFAGEEELARRARGAGARFSLVTENVAEARTSARIHELWMLSASHRANLLDPQVDAVGIAVVQRAGQLYAVEDFARSVADLTAEEQEAAVMELLVARGLAAVRDPVDARMTCGMETGYHGLRTPGFVLRYTSATIEQVPQALWARLASGQYREVAVGACGTEAGSPFSGYRLAVLLFP